MSTRSSSPSEDESPSKGFLSPRSKLKAFLDTTGSDSEEDHPSPSFKSTRSPRVEKDAESSDEDDVRPRGRFAARMLGSSESATKDAAQAETAESAPENARDRVRRLLGLGASDSPPPNAQEQPKAADTNGDAEVSEDDEDAPVTPHRRRRTERELASDLPADETPSSPGLFVSPGQKSPAGDNSAPEDDISLPKPKNSRFQALIDRKRREQEAKEAEEEAKRAARPAIPYDDDESSGVTDDDAGRKMSQGPRSQRKASKKAIEEMNRETQRMARRMQLAHQAMTKKKVTKAALFEKFGFKPAGAGAAPAAKAGLNSSSRPSTPTSDAEMRDAGTPPSSPPPRDAEKVEKSAVEAEEPEDNFLPADQIPPSSSPMAPTENKGKGVAVEEEKAPEPKKTEANPVRRVRVKLPPPTTNVVTIDDSDDELAISKPKNSKLDALFNQAPKKKKETGALHAFKCLAQVTSPGKKPHGKNDKPGMTAAEMQAMLRARAREQARVEKEKRIEMLKAKGVVIQTEEERRKEMEEVEDIVARAREEAEGIMQREREEAKKAKKQRAENGEEDPLGWDDSEDDDDYEDGVSAGEEGDVEDERDIELSGSEDEDDPEDEAPNPLFENEADEDEAEAPHTNKVDDKATSGQPEAADVDDEDGLPVSRVRRTKNTRVLSDDEDGDDTVVEATPKAKPVFFKSPASREADSPAAPTSVLRSATKTFIPGLPIGPAKPAGLGLTQMFAGTMGDSQMGTPSQPMGSIMPTFDPFVRPTMASQDMDDDVIMDSQPLQETQEGTQGVDLHYSQTQTRGLDSLLREDATQLDEDIQLTQDRGLEARTPLRERFVDVPMSTVSTVPASGSAEAIQESPLVRRGRLRRKMDAIPATAEEEAGEEAEEVPGSPERDEFGFNTTAFGVMKKAARDEERRKQREFDRKKSKAAGMVDEQAEESEDEYAGLGGADDDDASDGDLESVKDLIDDENKGNTAEDERNLAAFYADRERADAEKQVDQLFKDITTGALRRKRANDYDLSDSDDGGEARKRRKRAQFAKMQKALFADERVKKMSEDPGNQAFLRTLEDQISDDDMDLIDVVEEPGLGSSQSQSQEGEQGQGQEKGEKKERMDDVLVPNSQPTTDRPPAHMRRTKNGKKPSNIGEIRESLSSLLDEPEGSFVAPTELGSDSEDELSRDKENVGPRNAVKDRISLGRASGSSGAGRRAFTGSSQGAKAPTLLRRATSNSLVSNLSETSSKGSAGGDMFGEKIRKGAGRGTGAFSGAAKSGGIGKAESAGDAKRRERRMKGAEERLRAARGLFGGVAFE